MATSKESADRKAIVEQAKRDLERENEGPDKKWMRQAIREEVADALGGFFADDDDDTGKSGKDDKSLFERFGLSG
jgi:hypothetical protein